MKKEASMLRLRPYNKSDMFQLIIVCWQKQKFPS